MTERIFEGLRVLDLTTFVTGNFCSLMLANQGADVVKVERPGTGDDCRQSGPPFIGGESPYFWTVNYGKRSITLDLKTDEGRQALYDLAEKTDVFLQNYRPGVAERLGVGYDDIRAQNDQVVYCAISAFGQTGPWAERPGYDLLVQGLSGIMSVTGEAGRPPTKVGLPMTDLVAAMWAAFGVTSALYRRERTGEGDYIDLGMLDAALPWLTKQAGKVFAGEEPERMGTKDPVLAPYQTFETADGHVNVACLNDRLFERFCAVIDRPDVATDDRFASNADRVDNMDALESTIEDALAGRTTDEWMDALVEAGVPAAPVQSVAEALDNPQTEARNVMRTMEARGNEVPVIEHPLNFDHVDSGFERPPPALGEHTREVLAEAGYSDERLDELAGLGAFGAQDS